MKKTDHSHGYSFDIHKTKKVLIGSRFNSMKSEYLTFQCSLMLYQGAATFHTYKGVPLSFTLIKVHGSSLPALGTASQA